MALEMFIVVYVCMYLYVYTCVYYSEFSPSQQVMKLFFIFSSKLLFSLYH